MSIKARCGSCGANFQAQDSLAGRRVKCPKCAQPIVVASPGAVGKVAKGAAVAGGIKAHNPLLDLLDEVNVKSAARGPVCPNCSSEMSKSAVFCVQCGYNVETGKQLITSISDDDGDGAVKDIGVTDADRLMAKAEKDIADMPVTSHGQDFGDGADSFLIAGVAGVILVIVVSIGLGVIFTMDIVSKSIASWFISFLASVMLTVCMVVWITIVAFMQKPIQGILCVCTAGLWCIVFGFMQGRQLIIPTIILLISFLIGTASGVYTLYKGIRPAQETRLYESLPESNSVSVSQLNPVTVSESDFSRS